MSVEIVFKCEDSLWQMMQRSEKNWDARRWDMGDDRIYRLAQFDKAFFPIEYSISFLNKATGELLTMRYLGMEFAEWAPGWCFLRVEPLPPPRCVKCGDTAGYRAEWQWLCKEHFVEAAAEADEEELWSNEHG